MHQPYCLACFARRARLKGKELKSTTEHRDPTPVAQSHHLRHLPTSVMKVRSQMPPWAPIIHKKCRLDEGNPFIICRYTMAMPPRNPSTSARDERRDLHRIPSHNSNATELPTHMFSLAKPQGVTRS